MKDKNNKKDIKKEKIKIDDDFVDEEDNRVIVFVALALLIIIGTIIGLLVGCKKEEKEEDSKEPNKEYITPELEEDKTKAEEETTTTKTIKIFKTSTSQEETTNKEDTTYEIIYHYNDKTYISTTTDTAEKYVPDEYESCKYYTDEYFTNEFNFEDKVTASHELYLDCVEKTYTINYSLPSDNKTEYKLSDEAFELLDAQTDLIFEGWFIDEEYTNKITSINEDIIKYSNDGIINLYAKTVEYYIVNYYDSKLNIIESHNITKENLNDYIVLDASNLSTDDSRFLGWSKEQNSSVINYINNETMNISSNIDLYAVFGNSIVEFIDNDELIERKGITKEEAEEFELPTEDDLNLEAPTYIIPVDTVSDTTKNIVSDDTETVLENEIKLSDAIAKKAENYDPQVGDKVEEIKKELNWSIEKNIIDPETGDTSTKKVTDNTEIKEIIKNNAENNIDSELKTEWVESN